MRRIFQRDLMLLDGCAIRCMRVERDMQTGARRQLQVDLQLRIFGIAFG